MQKTSFRISRLNLLLLCAAALGVGCLWSFLIFYSAWKNQCHALLMESEIDQHRSERDYKKQYQTAMAQLEHCRGEAADLAAAASSSGNQRQQFDAAKDYAALYSAVQRRQKAECELKYGPGPYLVRLTLSVPQAERNAVLGIELNAELMPHTVFTFLELVRAKFYSGTTIGFSSGGVGGSAFLVGGNPADSSSWVKTSLTKRYIEYGYDSAPFMFRETVPTSKTNNKPSYNCVENSFGILDDGPDFILYLEEPVRTSKSHPLSCPGQIVQGLEDLPGLRATLTKGRVTIVEARIVRYNVDSEQSRQEL